MKKKIIQPLKNTVLSPYSEMSTEFKDSVAGISQQLATSGVKHVVISGIERNIGATTLAACLAEQEALYRKVLLIDCNIKAPRLADRYNLSGEGITNFTICKLDTRSIINNVSENLSIVTIGTAIEKASVFMFSGAFKAKFDELASGYDMVIIDSADMEKQSGALRLAGATGNILLVAGSYTRRKKIANAFHECAKAQVVVVGVVMNSCRNQ